MFRIAFRADIKKAIRCSMNSNGPGQRKSFTYILAREQAQLCEFGEIKIIWFIALRDGMSFTQWR